MSYTLYYFAVPVPSEFYQRLQQEKAFYILLAKSLGTGNFEVLDLEPDDFKEGIRFWIEEYPEVFDTVDRTIKTIRQFQTDIRSYSINSALLASYHLREIEPKLQALSLSQPEASESVQRLLYGEQPYDPHEAHPVTGFSDFRLVSPNAVETGATLLRDIPPERIFDVPESWQNSSRGSRWDNETARFFGYWREFYLEAAQGQKAVLIG